MIYCQIKQMGVSVIMKGSKNENQELNYIFLKNFEFCLLEETEEKKENLTVQVRIKYLNVDNNIDPQSLIPVNITPSKKLLSLDEQNNSYFLDMVIDFNPKSQNITYFHSIKA